MKIQCFHTKELSIKIAETSNVKRKKRMITKSIQKFGDILPKIDSVKNIDSKNSILVFVCVEEKDENKNLCQIAQDIWEYKEIVGAEEIVMGAFAHISSTPAKAEVAIKILNSLEYETKKICPETTQYPFGWDKSLDINLYCHPYNVTFKSY